MFKLGKLKFDVENATLSGSFMDSAMSKRMQSTGLPEFCWSIEIDMNEGDFVTKLDDEELEDDEEIYYESVSPRLYHNNGFRLDIKSWKDIEGLSLKWDSQYNANGEEAGTLYVFEYEDVTGGTIKFLERNGNKFLVRWTGTANVYWNDEYGEDVPFSFEGEVGFSGISANCDDISTLDELKIIMTEFINLDEYKCIFNSTYEIKAGISHVWRFFPENIDK
ncbi:hypothetical protein [Clostridium sp. ZBS18]|uniref:hypothetical protein n=1 Tax=Clostridium sp. ZBS18 TaxID=2949967 RepID=UPI00207ADC03|nr:hypothetical protein [Clostridium sp. ZBS18]